ncbi:MULTISPECIES: HIT family protein [Clostridia]|uniref:HIT domain-containing protein n=1 Tax=Intestinibacter bartlettii TaxID=261299 RepID=A0ABS6DWT2_9FIRM|nr:HIT domain-containing protein [Intestinibacter bartlettii]MBU5336306.1 HIT domain-containing protein [Intestinibacter bartlettii]MDO5011220.1 HIT domain-containing protein [Intestinibacter bartlettii]
MNCQFCQKRDYLLENEFAYAKFSTDPTTMGHILVVPKRHVSDYNYLTDAEKQAMHELVDMGKDVLAGIYSPSDYNLSMSIAENPKGEHLYFNLIPKYIEAQNTETEIA